MSAVYRWKPGVVAAVEAQTAGEELERLRTRLNGRLDAEDVVTAASAPTSPLHGAFEWDDVAAAHNYRLEQAKYLIRSVEVVISEETEKEPTSVRAFVSVELDKDRAYVSTLHALSVPELRAQVLSRAWAELEAWRRRHAELVEFAKVFSAIDQARPHPE